MCYKDPGQGLVTFHVQAIRESNPEGSEILETGNAMVIFLLAVMIFFFL